MAAAHFAAAIVTASMLMVVHPVTAQQSGAVQALIDKGKVTYAENCSHCHGPGLLNAGTITPTCAGFRTTRPAFSIR